jgi:hypothetical protein
MRGVKISELIQKLSALHEQLGDCPMTAVAIGMTTEFEVVDIVHGRPERGDAAHASERPSRAVLVLSLD